MLGVFYEWIEYLGKRYEGKSSLDFVEAENSAKVRLELPSIFNFVFYK